MVALAGGPRQAVTLVGGVVAMLGVGGLVMAGGQRAERRAGLAPAHASEAPAALGLAERTPDSSPRRGVAGFLGQQAMPAAGFSGVGCLGSYLESVRGVGMTGPLADGLSLDAGGVVHGPARLWSAGEDVAACFDESAPLDPLVLAQLEAQMRLGQPKFNIGARWLSTATNGAVAASAPITITWSFLPDGIPASPTNSSNPSIDNSVLFARMDALFGGNRALWISKFQEALDRWGELTGVTYVRVSTGGNDWDDGAAWGATGAIGFRGDVRIGMRNIDGGSGVLAFNNFPSSSAGGDMVLDSSENWASSGSNYRFLRNVVMHEHGHGLGLFHVCPTNLSKLMEPTYTSNFDGAQQDDVRAVQELYGDASEPNNSFGQRVDLGAVGPSQVVTRGVPSAPVLNNVSLYSVFGNDQDWFGFSIAQPLLIRVGATPLGSTYATAGCGSPPAQTNTNALSLGDLQVAVAGSTGTPFIVTSNAAPAGGVEQATNLLLAPGSYTFRVNATNSPTDPQMYTVTVAAQEAPVLTATPGVGQITLAWPSVVGGSYSIFRGTSTVRSAATLLTTSSVPGFVDASVVAATPYTYWVEASQGGRPLVAWGGPTTAQAVRNCGVSDLAGAGVVLGPDGELTADDVIVFISLFTASDARADLAGPGAVPGGDTEFTADDVIYFVGQFTAGCL
jgi:hypothetical protein